MTVRSLVTLLAALLAALFVVPAIGPVAGHGEGLDHATVDGGELAAGANETHALAFSEGPLQKGWVFVVNFLATNGSASNVELLLGERLVTAWAPAPDAVRHLTTLIPDTGNYSLRVVNPSQDANLTYAFFFDQSCNCVGKVLPAADKRGNALPGAMVIFNVDVASPMTLRFQLTEPKAQKVNVTAATLAAETARYPDDFDALAISAPATAIHDMEVKAAAPGRYYFFIESVTPRPERVNGYEDTLLLPQLSDASAPILPSDGGGNVWEELRAIATNPIYLLVLLGFWFATWPLIRRGRKRT